MKLSFSTPTKRRKRHIITQKCEEFIHLTPRNSMLLPLEVKSNYHYSNNHIYSHKQSIILSTKTHLKNPKSLLLIFIVSPVETYHSFNATIKMMRLVRRNNHVSAQSKGNVKKNRKQVSNYLKRIGRDFKLDSRGFCCIPIKKFVIILQVPDGDSRVFFDTKVYDLKSSRNPSKVQRQISSVQTQGVKFGKYDSVLHEEDGEVILSMNHTLSGLDFDSMVDCLEDFMRSSLNINKDLASIT